MSEESDALLHIADDHSCCKPTLLWVHNRLLELERENAELRKALREIAEASGFDNIGNWARNKAKDALKKEAQP